MIQTMPEGVLAEVRGVSEDAGDAATTSEAHHATVEIKRHAPDRVENLTEDRAEAVTRLPP